MNYTDLVARMASIAHRNDLESQMPNFVADANEKVNRRFNLAMVSPSPTVDTNAVLSLWPLLYLYSGLQSLYEHLNNGDNATYYRQAWEQEADRQNVTLYSPETDMWTSIDGLPPVIKPTGA
jgi:hypothetical protein